MSPKIKNFEAGERGKKKKINKKITFHPLNRLFPMACRKAGHRFMLENGTKHNKLGNITTDDP